MSNQNNSSVFRAGFVSLVGRPNVGKSSVLNALLGEKVAIVSPKAQTTRHRIHGILNSEAMQAVFVDTPGFCNASGSALMRTMRRVANQAVYESDVNVVIVEVPRSLRASAAEHGVRIDQRDEEVLATVHRSEAKHIVVVNKIDRLQDKRILLPWIQAYMAQSPNAVAVIPVSAHTGDGLDLLIKEIHKLLPEGDAIFPKNMHTDQAERFICAELIREQMLLRLRDEVPHSCMVDIESFEDGRRADDASDDEADSDSAPNTSHVPHDPKMMCHIEGRVVVERDSQKGIVVGKKGETIKAISTAARLEMEQLLGCRVFLRMQVVVRKDWTRNARVVQEFGFGLEDSRKS